MKGRGRQGLAAPAVSLAAALCGATTAAAFDVQTVSYLCDRGVEVPAVYVNDEAQGSVASLVVEGRLVALLLEPAASGARYGWPSDGSGYVWWTKGDTATLYWKDAAAGSETPLLTGCTVRP